MRRCTKCVLPETYPDIRFAANGECNICRTFSPYQYRGEAALREIVEPFRIHGGDYDCILALSGGRDSSYLLAYVVNELKLRPLAVTCDNGFMPYETKQSIANAVRILAVDHVYVRQSTTVSTFPPTLRAWQSRPDPATIAFLCNGCQGSIKRAILRAARDNRLGFVMGGGGFVGGGGEPERSFAEPLLRLGTRLFGARASLACGALIRLILNPAYVSNPSCLVSFAQEGYARFWLKYPKDLSVVGLFDFVEWNEDQIVSLIRERLRWTKPSYWPTTWRADCEVHWLKEYLYMQTLGFSKNDEILSGMVREGMITREEALARLRKVNELPKDFLAEFVAAHGVQFSQLRAACHRWRRSRQPR